MVGVEGEHSMPLVPAGGNQKQPFNWEKGVGGVVTNARGYQELH